VAHTDEKKKGFRVGIGLGGNDELLLNSERARKGGGEKKEERITPKEGRVSGQQGEEEKALRGCSTKKLTKETRG